LSFLPREAQGLVGKPDTAYDSSGASGMAMAGSCHKRQTPQPPTPQAPIRNRQTRKVANVKGLNRNTNLS